MKQRAQLVILRRNLLILKIRAHTTKSIPQKESQINFLALIIQVYELEHKLL